MVDALILRPGHGTLSDFEQVLQKDAAAVLDPSWSAAPRPDAGAVRGGRED